MSSPIAFGPASPFSTGRNLEAPVPVPLIPSNRPVPLMISRVPLCADGPIEPCAFEIIVEPSEKVMVVYAMLEPDCLIKSPNITAL